MYKVVALVVALSSFSVWADQSPVKHRDAYLSASYSSHEMLEESGDAFGIHFGMRNMFRNDFMVGGEVEGKVISNSALKDRYGLDEDFSLAANVLLGRRFVINADWAIDAYGLVGYSFSEVSPSMDVNFDGFKYGGGIDVLVDDWLFGVRYSQVNLDHDIDQSDITFMVGYKFHL